MDDALGQLLPQIRRPLGDLESRRILDRLAAAECPSLTSRRARRSERSGADHDPIVWAKARGANVVDTAGNVFVDLTAGFGVASVGHSHPRVVSAIQAQAEVLIHALGDVHPTALKVELLEALAGLLDESDDEPKVVLGLNGADAIAVALKTAMLATRKPGVIAFDGGYHGTMYGALAISGYAEEFRAPFAAQLNPHVQFAPYPDADNADGVLLGIDRALDQEDIGAVVIEPGLGRGGVRFAPDGFIDAVHARCREHDALLVVDEIFTGIARTGTMRAYGGDADIVCFGKALGGGLPLSACVGTARAMRSWGDPSGEAIHAATFAGDPLACRAGLEVLSIVEDEALADRSASLGSALRAALEERLGESPHVRAIRGRGLMVGVELDDGARTLRWVRRALESGYIVLAGGSEANVLCLTPPLTIAPALLTEAVEALADALERDP